MKQTIRRFKLKFDMSILALFLALISVCFVFVGASDKKYIFASGTVIEVSSASDFKNAVESASYGDEIQITTDISGFTAGLTIKTSLTISGDYTLNLGGFNITIEPACEVEFKSVTITSTYKNDANNGINSGVITVKENASLLLNYSNVEASNWELNDISKNAYNAIYCHESAMLSLNISDVIGNIDITNSATLSAERLIDVQGVIKATASSLPIITNFALSDQKLPLYFENKQDLEEVSNNSGYVVYNGNTYCKVELYKNLQKTEKYINYSVSITGTLIATAYTELDLNVSAGSAIADHYFWVMNNDGVNSVCSQEDIYKEYPSSTTGVYNYAYKNIYDYSSYTEISSTKVDGNPIVSVGNDGWVTFRNIYYNTDTLETYENYARSQYPTFFTKSRPEAVTPGKSYVAVLEVLELRKEGTIYLNLNSQNDSTFDSQFEPNVTLLLEKTGVYYVGLIGASFQNSDAANYFLRSHLNLVSGSHIDQIKLRLKVLEVGEERNSSEQLTSGLTAAQINAINKTYLQRVLGKVVNTSETAKVTNVNIMVAYYRPGEYYNARGEVVYPYIANGDYLPTVFKKGDSLKGWATTAQNGSVIDYSAIRTAKTLYAQYNSSASIKLLINHDEKFSVLNEGGNNNGALYLEKDSVKILTQFQTGVEQVAIDKDTGVITIYKNTALGYFGEGVEDLYITITNPTTNEVIRKGRASENLTIDNIGFTKNTDNFKITFNTSYLSTLTYMPIVQVDIIWQKRIVTVDLNSDINDKAFDTNEVASFNGIDVVKDANDKWVHSYEVEYGNSINTTKKNWFNPKLNTDGNSRPNNQLGSTILLNEDGWLEYNDENSSAYPRVFTDYNEEFANYIGEYAETNRLDPTSADIPFTLFIEVRDFEYIERHYDANGTYLGASGNIPSITFSPTNNFSGGNALIYDGQKYNIYSQFNNTSVTITGDGIYKVKLKFNGTTFKRRKNGEKPEDDSIDQYYFLRSDFNNAITASNGKTVAKGNLSCKLRFKLIEGYSAGDSYIYTKYGESNLVAERSKYVAQDYIVYDATGTKIMEQQGKNSQIDAPDGNGVVSKIDIWSFPTINKITTNLTVKVKWYGAVAYYGVSSTLDGAQESFANFQEALNKAVQYGGYLEIYGSVKYDVESSLDGKLSATYTGSNAEQVVNIYTKNTKDVNLTLGSSSNISFNNIKFVINGLGSGYKNVNITTSNETLFNLNSLSKLVLNSGEFTASDEVVHHSGDELTIKGDTTLNGSVGLYLTHSLHRLPTKLYLGGSPTFNGDINVRCTLPETRTNPTTDSNDAQIHLISDFAPKGNFNINIDENQFIPESNVNYLLINTQRHKITMGDINNIISADDRGKGCSLGKVTYDGTVYLTVTKNLKYTFNLNEKDNLTYNDGKTKKEILPTEVENDTSLTPSQNAKLTQGYVKQQNVQLIDYGSGYQRIDFSSVLNSSLLTTSNFNIANNVKVGAYFESTENFLNSISGIGVNGIRFYKQTYDNSSVLTKTEYGSAVENYFIYSATATPTSETEDALKGEIIYGNNGEYYYMYIFITPLSDYCFDDAGRGVSYYYGKLFLDIHGSFTFYNRNDLNSRYFNDCKDENSTLIKYAGQMFYENNGTRLTNTYIAPADTTWHAAIPDVSSIDFYTITSIADIAANGKYYNINNLQTALSEANGKSLYILKNGLTAPNITGYNFTLDTEIISADIDESFTAYTKAAITGGKQINFNNITLSATSGKTITISYLNTSNLKIDGSQNLTITSGSFNGDITCNNLTVSGANITSSSTITINGNLDATGATAHTTTGSLKVVGNATNITNYTITKAAEIGGTANISGSTFNNTLAIAGAATISGSTLNGKLTLTSKSGTNSLTDTTITTGGIDASASTRTLNLVNTSVEGNVTVGGSLIATGGKTINGNLTVTGSVGDENNKFDYSVTGNVIVGGLLQADGSSANATITGTLTANHGTGYIRVTGYTINGVVTINGIAIVDNCEFATGLVLKSTRDRVSTITNSTITNGGIDASELTFNLKLTNTNVEGNVTVGGYFTSNVNDGGIYSITGALTVKGTGASSISNYTITGATTIAGSATITSSTFNSTLTVGGKATVTGSTFNGETTLNGTENKISTSSKINAALNLNGSTIISGCTFGTSSLITNNASLTYSGNLYKITNTANGKITFNGTVTAASGSSITLDNPSQTKANVQLTFASGYAKGGSNNITIKYTNATTSLHYLLLNNSGKTSFYSITLTGGYNQATTSDKYVVIHKLTETIIRLNVYGNSTFTVNLKANKNFYTEIGGTGVASLNLAIGTNTIYLDSATTLAYRVTAGGSAARYATSKTSEEIQINTVDESITLSSNKATITIYDVISVTYTRGDADGGTLPENNPYYYTYSNFYFTLDKNLTKFKKKQTGWSIQGTNGRLFINEHASVNRILEPVFEDVIIWASNSADGMGGVYYDTLQEAASSSYTYIEIVSSILDTSYVGSNFNRSGKTVYIFASNTNVELKNQGITFTAGTFYFGDNDETRTANKGFKLTSCTLFNKATLTCIGITGALVVNNYSNIVVDNSVLNTFNNYAGVVTLKGTITAASGASLTFDNPSQTKENVQLIIDSAYKKGGSFNFKIKYTNASSVVHYILLNNSTAHTSYTGFCSIELTTNDGYSIFTNGKYVGIHKLEAITFKLTAFGNTGVEFEAVYDIAGYVYDSIGGSPVSTITLAVTCNNNKTLGATVTKTVYAIKDEYYEVVKSLTKSGSNDKYGQNNQIFDRGEFYFWASHLGGLVNVHETLYDVLKVTYTKGNDAENNPTLPNDGYVIYNNSYTVSDVYPLTRFKYKQNGWALSDAASTKVTTINNVATNKTLVPFWQQATIWASNSVDGAGGVNFATLQEAANSSYSYIEVISRDQFYEDSYGEYEDDFYNAVQGAEFNRESGNVYIFTNSNNTVKIAGNLTIKGNATYYLGDFDDGDDTSLYKLEIVFGSCVTSIGTTTYCNNVKNNDNAYGIGFMQDGGTSYFINSYFGSWGSEQDTTWGAYIKSGTMTAVDSGFSGRQGLVVENGATATLINSSVTSYSFGIVRNYLSAIVNRGTLNIGSGVNIHNMDEGYHYEFFDELVNGQYYGSYGILNTGTLNMSGGTINHTGDAPVWTDTAQNGIAANNFYRYHAFVAGILNTGSGKLNITGGSINVTGGANVNNGYYFGIFNNTSTKAVAESSVNTINGATISGGCGVIDFTKDANKPKLIIGNISNTFIYSTESNPNAAVTQWGIGSGVFARDNSWLGNYNIAAIEIYSKANIGYSSLNTKASGAYGAATWLRSCHKIEGGNIYGSQYGIYLKDSECETVVDGNANVEGGSYAVYLNTAQPSTPYGNIINIKSANLKSGGDYIIYSSSSASSPKANKNTITIGSGAVLGSGTSDATATNKYGVYVLASNTVLNLEAPTIYAKIAELYIDTLSTTEAFVNLKSNITSNSKAIRIASKDEYYEDFYNNGTNANYTPYLYVKVDGGSLANVSVVKPASLNVPDCESLSLVESNSYGVLGYGDRQLTLKWSYDSSCDNDVMAFITLISDNGRYYSYALSRGIYGTGIGGELTLTGLRNCTYSVIVLAPTNHKVVYHFGNTISPSKEAATYSIDIQKSEDAVGFYSADNSTQVTHNITLNNATQNAEGGFVIENKANILLSKTQEKVGNKVYINIDNFEGTIVGGVTITTDTKTYNLDQYITTAYGSYLYYFIMPNEDVTITINLTGTSSFNEIQKDSSLTAAQRKKITVTNSVKSGDVIDIKVSDTTTTEIIITYTLKAKEKIIRLNEFVKFNGYVMAQVTIPTVDEKSVIYVSYKTS